jgi:hypothetical protein
VFTGLASLFGRATELALLRLLGEVVVAGVVGVGDRFGGMVSTS